MAVVRSLGNEPAQKPYFEKLGTEAKELHELILRKLRSKKFVQFKSRASVVPVTDAEALQYFQKNRVRFGNAPFAKFRDSIKSLLAQDQASRRIREWFEILQKKYHVRRVVENKEIPKN